ncbi:MAG: hypothetical protein ABI435_05535 [Pseudolysinimonas sp.]
MMSWKDLKDPGFRRFYIGLWIVIALVLVGIFSQAIPTGTLKNCTVTSIGDTGDPAVIKSSCGSLISYGVLSRFLKVGSTYDFQMKGIIVRHIDSWVESRG